MENHTSPCPTINSTINEQERNKILFVLSSVGLISTITCFFALFLAVWFKLYKHFVHRLAAYQVLSSLFFDLVCCFQVSFVGYDDDSGGPHVKFCTGMGFLLEYSMWIKLLFMLWLVVHLFCFSVLYKSLERYEKMLVLGLILFPLLFVWIPFIHNVYGLAGVWCWIQNWKDNCPEDKFILGMVEEYVLLHGPFLVLLITAVVLIVVMVMVLVRRSWRYSSMPELQPLIVNHQTRRALKELISLVAYPIFFFLLLIPAFANRIYGTVHSEFNVASFFASGIAIPSIGFFSGMTLIVHVIILERHKVSRSTTVVSNDHKDTLSPTDAVNHASMIISTIDRMHPT